MKERRFAFVIEQCPDLSVRWNTNTLRPIAPLPPLGVLTLAAVLEREGWSVAVFDNSISKYPKERLLAAITAFQPGVVGLSMTSLNAPGSLELAALLSEAGVPLLAGGPHASVRPREVARAIGITGAVAGEADLVIAALAEAVAGGQPVPEMSGIYTADSGEGVIAPPGELDDLPDPARHLVPIESYWRTVRDVTDGAVDSLATSRGCPFQCTFCSNPGAWGSGYRRHRTRSAASVADEMEHLLGRYGSEGFFFREDNMTVSRAHVLALCDEFERRGFRYPWKCEAHVATVDEQVLERMVGVGLRSVWLGIESGSDRMLRRMRKGFSAGRAKELLLFAKSLGLHTASGFLLGLPGETEDDISASVRLAEQTEMDDVWFQVYIGYPGSALYEEIRAHQFVEAQWHTILIPRTEIASFADSSKREGQLREHFRQLARVRCA